MKRLFIFFACALLPSVLSAAPAGGPVLGRQIQIGTKTLPPMTVGFVARSTALADIGKQIAKEFGDLWATLLDNGFHPMTVGVVRVRVDELPGAGQPLPWEAWLPVAEEPAPQDLGPNAVVRVKQIPATDVAFTYCTGGFEELQNVFGTLASWAMQKNLQLTGEARVVFWGMLQAGDKQVPLLECQLAVQPPVKPAAPPAGQ